MSGFLYGDVAPSMLSDDQLEHLIREIGRALESCKKLKAGPWIARISTPGSWQDDPCSTPAEVIGYVNPRDVREGDYLIARGTIHDTQREVIFMASMRDDYPEALRLWLAALVHIRELRKARARAESTIRRLVDAASAHKKGNRRHA
jgi:hypothetical protein